MGTTLRRGRLVRMRWHGRIMRMWASGLALMFVTLLAPPSALACSCAQMDAREQFANRGEAALVVGQVVRDRSDGSFDFAVTRWYGGQDRRPLVVLQSAMSGDPNGVVSFNTCGMTFTVGQRLLFLGGPSPDGRYSPGICGLSADPTTPGGADYERLAAQLIGPPVDPQAVVSEQPPTAASSGGPDLGIVAGGIGAAVALLFAGVVLVGRRRRHDPT